ncbi:MAG: aminotransferase class IV [Bacteriovoracaceae bacterium]|nr:aminotransferase class IV [Bacteriovoracaceae bacterium]
MNPMIASQKINYQTHDYLVSVNGNIMNASDAKVSIMDRGFLFGDSVYDVFFCYKKMPVFFYEHLDRLYQSAQRIDLPMNFDRKQLIYSIKELVAKNPFEESFMRIVVTRGENEMGLAPQSYHEVQNTIVLYLKKFHMPTEWMSEGVDFKISTFERNSKKAMDPMNKTGNYLNSQLALNEAKKENYHDAIMLNAKGEITEGTTNNFWIVQQNGNVVTPDLKSGLLRGITREKIFEIAKALNISIEEKILYPSDIESASESFYTSATKGIVPITKINHLPIGSGKPGNITKQLMKGYEDLVQKYIRSFSWSD